MTRVAVISSGEDETALSVVRALRRHGARPVFIDTSRVPEKARLSLEDGRVFFENEPLHELRSAYVKSLALGIPLYELDSLRQRTPRSWPRRWLAERERNALLTSAFRALELSGAHLVNPVSCFEVHLLKPLQREQLARAGIRVPASLTTTDPAAVRAFAERHGELIYKPLAGGALVRRLEPSDLRRLSLLRTAPVFFQQRIEGDEVRVTVLDGRVIGAWRLPARGVIDARTVLEQAEGVTPARPVAAEAIAAARALGLVFTSVDLRIDDDGKPWVLECNPTPALTFYESKRRGSMAAALAQHLVAAARRG